MSRDGGGALLSTSTSSVSSSAPGAPTPRAGPLREWLQCGNHLPFRSYENRLRTEVDSACRWCGEDPETISHIFQRYPQLALERADAGVSNPRDLWGAPAVTLRFVRAIGLIPGLD